MFPSEGTRTQYSAPPTLLVSESSINNPVIPYLYCKAPLANSSLYQNYIIATTAHLQNNKFKANAREAIVKRSCSVKPLNIYLVKRHINSFLIMLAMKITSMHLKFTSKTIVIASLEPVSEFLIDNIMVK